MRLALGSHDFDVTHRAVVMGVLNRAPDSFYDGGRFFDLDACCRRAERLVGDGADVLDVGGVKAGPGPEVGEAEEIDRVAPAIEALHARFDMPELGYPLLLSASHKPFLAAILAATAPA